MRGCSPGITRVCFRRSSGRSGPGAWRGRLERRNDGGQLARERQHAMTTSASSMAVPYNDLRLQHAALQPALNELFARVLRDSSFIRGPEVDAFEREFAAKVGVPHCVSCANGTDALYIAMRALRAGPGDEVITTAQTWISTAETITQTGARVVFCDVDETFNIDPVDVERKITPRTRGIVPVHLYGQPADMTALMAIARAHGLWLV